MFDLSKRKYIENIKVKDLISILEGENQEAILTVDALEEFYIHVTEDNNHVALDLSSLEDYYREDYKKNNIAFPEDLNKSTEEPFKVGSEMPRMECLILLQSIVDNVSHQFLLSHGFTQEQIDAIKGEQ